METIEWVILYTTQVICVIFSFIGTVFSILAIYHTFRGVRIETSEIGGWIWRSVRQMCRFKSKQVVVSNVSKFNVNARTQVPPFMRCAEYILFFTSASLLILSVDPVGVCDIYSVNVVMFLHRIVFTPGCFISISFTLYSVIVTAIGMMFGDHNKFIASAAKQTFYVMSFLILASLCEGVLYPLINSGVITTGGYAVFEVTDGVMNFSIACMCVHHALLYYKTYAIVTKQLRFSMDEFQKDAKTSSLQRAYSEVKIKKVLYVGSYSIAAVLSFYVTFTSFQQAFQPRYSCSDLSSIPNIYEYGIATDRELCSREDWADVVSLGTVCPVLVLLFGMAIGTATMQSHFWRKIFHTSTLTRDQGVGAERAAPCSPNRQPAEQQHNKETRAKHVNQTSGGGETVRTCTAGAQAAQQEYQATQVTSGTGDQVHDHA